MITGLILAYDKSVFQSCHRRQLLRLAPHLAGIKIGLEAYTAFNSKVSVGAQLESFCKKEGIPFFADLKLHDIENTTVKAAHNVARRGAWMLTEHASVGESTMRATKMRIKSHRTKLIAVTVLSNLVAADTNRIFRRTPKQAVFDLACMANAAKLDGIVCSGEELKCLEAMPPNFLRIVVGIRYKRLMRDDQARMTTPREAAAGGAHYIVCGRVILDSDTPLATTIKICRELKQGSRERKKRCP